MATKFKELEQFDRVYRVEPRGKHELKAMYKECLVHDIKGYNLQGNPSYVIITLLLDIRAVENFTKERIVELSQDPSIDLFGKVKKMQLIAPMEATSVTTMESLMPHAYYTSKEELESWLKKEIGKRNPLILQGSR